MEHPWNIFLVFPTYFLILIDLLDIVPNGSVFPKVRLSMVFQPHESISTGPGGESPTVYWADGNSHCRPQIDWVAIFTLQGTNTSHLWKRKIIDSKVPLKGVIC